MDQLQTEFIKLASKFSANEKLINTLWSEIERHYQAPGRHYHNLTHLKNMATFLEPVRKQIRAFDVILFSVFYHDVIYDATAGDNEEKSAAFARERLKMLSVGIDTIDKVTSQIIATKRHDPSPDGDTNYLLDADLAILGQDWETYRDYGLNIRKEYAIYPNVIYNAGRKNVVSHFLSLAKVFKTVEFSEKFELQAKENLAKEAKSL